MNKKYFYFLKQKVVTCIYCQQDGIGYTYITTTFQFCLSQHQISWNLLLRTFSYMLGRIGFSKPYLSFVA